MKGFEILIPSQLQEEVSMHTDPLLFAYRQYWYPDAAAHHSHKPGEAEVEVRLWTCGLLRGIQHRSTSPDGTEIALDVNLHLIIWITKVFSDRFQ